MIKKTWCSILVLALLVVGVLLVPVAANADCNEYYNSTRTYIYGYGFACAGSGGTCTECTSGSGGSCTYNGPGSCDPIPENQW